MTTYNTGNPVGSVDVRDLYDNAQNFDNFSNSASDFETDRFGVSRETLQGIRNASQYQVLGPYAAGLEFTSYNQVFSYLGEFYAPGPAITLPYTTTGAGAGEIANFRSVGDAVLRDDLSNDTDPARGATLVGYESGTVSDFLRAFNQQGSGNFFVEYGARVDKLRDRVLIGDAAKHNGTNITTQDDWLTIYQIAKGRSNGFVQSCQAAIETQNNLDVSNCLVLGARTSSLYDNYNAIGLISIATSNKSTGNGMAYGGYFEAYRDAGAVGGCYGFETDTMNYVGVVQTDPYQQLIGQTIGVQIAAGGEYSPTGQFPSSAAINIRKNGSTFERGIVFGADALTGATGASGSAPAIVMGKGHGIVWYSGAGASTSAIYCNGTNFNQGTTLNFTDGAVTFGNSSSSKNVFRIANIGAVSANYPAVSNSASGDPVQLLAYGTDTNIDIQLVPQGTGAVWLGVRTASVDAAVNGYITVKDSTGVIRKLATIA